MASRVAILHPALRVFGEYDVSAGATQEPGKNLEGVETLD